MSKPVSPEHTQALWMLLLANLFWGLSFPTVKALLLLHDQMRPGLDPWFSAVYTVAPRFILAVIVLTVWHEWRRRTSATGAGPLWRATRDEWRQGLLIGLFTAVGMLLQNDALNYTEASTSAFLTQITSFLIPIWIAIRSRRNPGLRVWFCCVLVMTGVAILGRFNWQTLRFGRGEWETMLSALFFMGQILTLDRADFAANRSLQVTWIMFSTEAVVFWALAFAAAPDFAMLAGPWTSGPWLGLTMILTLFCTFGSFGLMTAWQPKITATEAGLMYCIEPIFASLMALFLPGIFSVWAAVNYANERATWTLLGGGALITLANVILQLKPPERRPV
jgi:drug/metabolite transporter (DMT)-like permease